MLRRIKWRLINCVPNTVVEARTWEFGYQADGEGDVFAFPDK